MITSIEVLKGAGSALYGSDAIGGADIGSGKWVSACLFLIGVSGLLTVAWLALRRWRRRRLRVPAAADA